MKNERILVLGAIKTYTAFFTGDSDYTSNSINNEKLAGEIIEANNNSYKH